MYCLNIAWESLFSQCNSVNDYWNTFSEVLNDGISKFVPTKVFKQARRKQNPCKKIRQLTAKKRKFWKLTKRWPVSPNKNRYKKAVLNLKNAILWTSIDRENKILSSGNIGAFYKHVNSRLSH